MEIKISAGANEVLGPEHSPYLELELTEDGTATLRTGERHGSHKALERIKEALVEEVLAE